MRPHVNMFDGAVSNLHSMFEVQIRAVAASALNNLLHERQIVRVDTLEDQSQRGRRIVRAIQNAERLFRPEEPSRGDVPPKTARSAQSLRLGEVGFAAPQRFLIARMDDRNSREVRDLSNDTLIVRHWSATTTRRDRERAEHMTVRGAYRR